MLYFPSGDLARIKVPEITITRLSLYSRLLQDLENKGVTMAMSSEIASGTGVNAAQVRKDLAYFGEFGLRGVGYNIKELNVGLRNILGLDKEWKLAVVGAGNIGRALGSYNGFGKRNFSIAAVFDNDPEKVGKKMYGFEIHPIESIAQFAKENKLDIGVIAVPVTQAQDIADKLVEANFTAILNFAPIVINVPKHISLRNIDLCVNLEMLTFKMVASAAHEYPPVE